MKKYAIALCPILAAAALAGIHFYSLDGLDGWFFRSGFGGTFEDTTQYASGYSDAAFRKVRKGMTEADVHALLGTPLDRWEIRDLDNTNTIKGIGLRWTRSSCYGSYSVRAVNMKDGTVIERISEFYMD